MIMNRTSPPMLALIPAQVMKIKTNYFSDLKLCNSKILINVKKILYPQKKKNPISFKICYYNISKLIIFLQYPKTPSFYKKEIIYVVHFGTCIS